MSNLAYKIENKKTLDEVIDILQEDWDNNYDIKCYEIDIDNLQYLNVNYLVIPNIQENGVVSSPFDNLLILKLFEGTMAIEFSYIDDSNIVEVPSDDISKEFFTFDKEYYLKCSNSLSNLVSSL
ncbi:hypothetical protein [Senegalia massiliensis]|uniref:Uncharacterized protein n=1 Tax=Senegalia massiliensis TaxID=1720316 RepID=A0A845R0W5_9CLOT|nr:hypothetical protein [Senegalia massiliensis]NBI07649.1 hypothetical protein [Senegalia massiliensis]